MSEAAGASSARWREGFLAGAETRRGQAHGLRLPWIVPDPEAGEPGPADALAILTEDAARNQPPDAAERVLFGRLLGLHYLAPAKDGFLLRVRVAGGQMREEQRRGLADVAREFASGVVELEPQGGWVLQTIAVRDAPDAWRREAALGLVSLL